MAPQDPKRQPQAFKFVNISNPDQAKERKRKGIVRRYVRPVSTNSVSLLNANQSSLPNTVSAEIGENGLAFVNTTHPDQVKTAEMRMFVKQNAQRRLPRKISGNAVIVPEEDHLPIVSSWSRDLPKARKPTSAHDRSEGSSSRSDSLPLIAAVDDMETDPTPREDIDKFDLQAGREVADSWSRHLPKRKRKESSRCYKNSRQEIQAHQSRFRVSINAPGTQWEKVVQIIDRDAWPMAQMPCNPFPIKMNPELNGLVTYLHTEHEITHIPSAFMASWFCIIIQDAAAFQSLLSLVAKQQALVHGVTPKEIGLRLYGNALTSVHERLGDPDEQRSINLFTGVLMFLALDLLQLDPVRFKINVAGVKRLIKMHGGISFLDNHSAHRTFLLVAELCGAYTFDLHPTYYVQGEILQREVRSAHFPMPKILSNQLSLLQQRLPSYPTLYNALHDIYALSTHVRRDGAKAFCVKVALDPSVYIVPMRMFQIIHDIETSTDSDEVKAMLAVVASAGVLCMNVFRIAIADCPTLVHRNHVLRMKAAIELSTGMWNGLEDIYLWCLMQGSIMASGDHRVVFVELVREYMRTQGMVEWTNVMDVLEKMFFVELMFRRDYEVVGEQVMSSSI